MEYASHEDMKNALKKLDGADLNGRRLKLIDDSRSSRKRRLVVHFTSRGAFMGVVSLKT